ncbi:MAG: hypothetical protein CMF23_15785 [Ignavibacteriae bacterium]|nr:hypothetical protein [Ignavibacteriota bacterium]
MVLKNLLATIFVFLSPLLYSGTIQTQGTGRVIGTICNEKIIGDKLFICEYGTQVCRMVTFDPRIVVDNLVRTLDPQELKVGWYVEAEIDSTNHLKRIKINQGKTIICFLSSIEKESNNIKNLLENIRGIKSVEINTKFSQANIEYDQFTISYDEIVETIKDANFEIE